MRFAVFLVHLILFVNISLAAEHRQILADLEQEMVLRTHINNQWTITRVFHCGNLGFDLESKKNRLKSYQHPNLVKVLDLKFDHGILKIIEEDIDYHNNLFSLIFDNNRKITFTVEQKLKILLEIAQAFSYLTEKDGAFEPYIDLICINDNRVKLSRYYKIFNSANYLSIIDIPECLNMRFIAPELFNPNNQMSLETLIYKFGSIMLAVLAEELPYSQYDDPSELFQARISALQPEIPQVISSDHAQLIRRCLLICPQERPKLAEIISLLQNYSTQSQGIIEVTNTNIWSDIYFNFFAAWQWAG
jgi:serine/threonine protein kinase